MDTETSAGRIEETLLGGPRRYNRVQVSEATGVDRDRAHRLWMAMGFAEVGDEEAVFTDGDIEALRTWNALVESGMMVLDDEVPHARVMGQTLSRLAEWQAREVMARADVLAPGGADRPAAFDIADTLLPVIEHLQSYVWRRHLAAAYERILLAPPGERTTPGEITERYARACEIDVRDRPADWLWSYRRWRLKKPLYGAD